VSTHDVAIVGSGHNALITACLLARDGRDVVVLERDSVIGGAVSTVERWPGVRVDRGSSLHVMVRGTGLIEELDLPRFGLRYLDCDPWAWAPPGITFHADLAHTCEEIGSRLGAAAAREYEALVTAWTPRARLLLEAMGSTVGPRALWRTSRGGRRSPAELVRSSLASADTTVDEHVSDPTLRGVLAWLAAQSGPATHEAGTAALLCWAFAMHDGLTPGRPVGGSGMLTQALADCLRSHGGRIITGDEVTAIEVTAGHASGLRTASGRQVDARVVVAGCHALSTARLCAEHLAPVQRNRAERLLQPSPGMGMVLRCRTRAAPLGSHAGMALLVTSRGQVAASNADYQAGRDPADPPVLAMTPTVGDASLAPAGEHVVTLWSQWHRRDLDWDGAVRERAVQRILATTERHCPGFGDDLLDVHPQTPADLERELGLLGGDVMHLPTTLDRLAGLRPLPEWSRRTPIPGLFTTGASTHPGGGVWGASGAMTADLVTRSLRRRALRPGSRGR
jgi:phytoene dehydrogenase-like protein